MILATAIVFAVLTSAPTPVPIVQDDAQCLHAPGRETPEQRERRVAALSAMRAINTAQANFAQKNNRTYASREELAGWIDAARFNLAEKADIVPGFTLTLDVMPKGYWFSVTDTTDPCGFRFISNQQGLIFTAQPIR
jgi:hypothetical protein